MRILWLMESGFSVAAVGELEELEELEDEVGGSCL